MTALTPPKVSAIENFEPDAAAAIIMDADSGDVLFSYNEHERRAPASTTKLMTALVVVEAIEAGEIGLTDVVTATEFANYDLTWDSSTQNIQEGEQLTVEHLLYCALVASANESCNILAEHVSGSVEAFLERMNRRLQELGCYDTHFENTHGLPLEGHYTSAYDMALIGRASLSHPLIVKIANTVNYTIPATNLSKERKLITTNYLLHKETPHYYYEFAQGLKTGSTDAAGHCLVSSAAKNGMQVIGVILGAKAIKIDTGEFRTQSFIESKRMYEWFFENFAFRDVLKSSELIDSIPVKLGKNASEVIVHPETGLRKIMPIDTDVNSVTARQISLDIPEGGIEAPVTRGQ
ncbi:MAG: D-alanyl-D-alanine carboxypeptidase, partial [Oscillospiraceae bacterium]|nr:D-alanyl-D-alanine carboxypeptidase [Oscillospiraceae bacterium]